MKKIIATVLATVMILSILATIAIVPATAADEDKDSGDWAVYAPAKTYKDENGEMIYEYDDPTMSRTNIYGYEYTDKGFNVAGECSSNTATTQRINVVTKNEVNLNKGVHMTVEVDKFTAGGDYWFSFSIWDEPNLDHGAPGGEIGNGYLCLLRPGLIQNYIADESWYDPTNTMLEPGSETSPCRWNGIDVAQNVAAGTPCNWAPNEEGVYTFTLDLQCDTTGTYRLFICGQEIPASPALTNYINYRFQDGMAYIGFAIRGSLTDCENSLTITEFNGKKPTGTDKADQVYNVEPVGPMIYPEDPTQPVLLFDSLNAKGEFEKTGEFATTSKLKAIANYDGSFTLYPQAPADSYFAMTPDSEFSYEASDYPYAAVLLRNFCNCTQYEGEEYECMGNADNHIIEAYFSAGSVFEADGNYFIPYIAPAHAEEYTDMYGNTYLLYVIDFSSDPAWQGRINSFRIDFDFDEILLADKDKNHFDLCYMGYFSSFELAAQYAVNYKDSYVECAHEDVEIIEKVEPECTKTGSTAGMKCNTCGRYVQEPELIPALKHDYKDSAAKAATCTEPGVTAGQICERCGETTGTPIPKIPHNMVYNNTVEEGHYKVCSYGCGEETEMEAHTLDEDKICTVCGYGCAHENQSVKVTVAPTCEDPGMQAKICDDCGSTMLGTEEVVAALGHTEEVLPAVEPTCTEAGRKEGKKCTVCGKVTVSQASVPALGHTEEIIPGKAATCTEAGVSDGKKCTVCGVVIEESAPTPAAGHEYDDTSDTDCNVCGETRKVNAGQQPTDNKPAEDNGAEEEKKGCGSVIGLGAFAVITTVALAGVVCFKKKD